MKNVPRQRRQLKLTLAACVCAISALAGCSGNQPIEVQGMYGPGVPFDRVGREWAWVPAPRHPSGDPYLDNPELQAFIQQSIQHDLASRGCVQVTAEAADVWIDYFVGKQSRLFEYRGSGFSEFEEGSLVIDLISPQTHVLMWRGVASAHVNATDAPAKRKERIQQAVRKTFDWLPWCDVEADPARGFPTDTTDTN
jgi:hypothetical protein